MHETVEKAIKQGGFTEPLAWELFSAHGIPAPRCKLVKTQDEAVEAAEQIGYPVVLKIVSKDILHKSDAGGVAVKLADGPAVREAYDKILKNARAYAPDATIDGILVCEMLTQGVECIIGMLQDASFGPVMMFGLGGIFVEVLKDVAFRVLPLTKADALAMIEEIKGSALLMGARGQAKLDCDAMAELILKVASMVEANPQIREIDINPCFIYEKGVMPADARIMF